jgi:hypothetical protein
MPAQRPADRRFVARNHPKSRTMSEKTLIVSYSNTGTSRCVADLLSGKFQWRVRPTISLLGTV